MNPKYRIADFARIPGVACPCGTARRGFMEEDNHIASVHLVDIGAEAKPHYHKKMTEIYFILEGKGFLELDGERIPVEPYTAVMIHPGTRHRALGEMRILNVPIPKFDPADEWLD